MMTKSENSRELKLEKDIDRTDAEKMLTLLQGSGENNFCPNCQHYIDKVFIYRDPKTGISKKVNTYKDCRFRTDKQWICDYKECCKN